MPNSIELRSEKCVVRTYHPDDAPSLAANGNNRRIWVNLRDRFPHPFTAEGGRMYINYCIEADEPSFAIEVDGQAIGGISLHLGQDVERIGAELGYWIGEPYWGRGIATAAIKLIVDYGFRERALLRIWAVPFATNLASCRALEKNGFTREGTLRSSAIKDGKVCDQHMYSRIRA